MYIISCFKEWFGAGKYWKAHTLWWTTHFPREFGNCKKILESGNTRNSGYSIKTWVCSLSGLAKKMLISDVFTNFAWPLKLMTINIKNQLYYISGMSWISRFQNSFYNCQIPARSGSFITMCVPTHNSQNKNVYIWKKVMTSNSFFEMSLHYLGT